MRIALVAHDARKQELVEWCTHNAQTLSKHTLFGTGTTARLLGKIPVMIEPRPEGTATMDEYIMSLKVEPLLSGPLGGDQQIGAMIAEGKIDCLIFFCDNLIMQGHQQDVGALVRLASLYNVAFATNRTTADMIMTSPLFGNEDYKRIIPGAIEKYKNRFVEREENSNKEPVKEESVKEPVQDEETEEEKVDEMKRMWEEIPESIKSKIIKAREQNMDEVELDKDEVLSDREKFSLIRLGYSIITVENACFPCIGNPRKIKWVNDSKCYNYLQN